MDKSRAHRTTAESRKKKPRTARERQESAAIASTSDYPLLHRSADPCAARRAGIAPDPLRRSERPALRRSCNGPARTTRPPSEDPEPRTHERSHIGRRQRVCDVLVTSMARAAAAPPRGIRVPTAAPGTGWELSTPLPWDDCGYGHTLGCARLSAARRPDDPQRPHPLVHPQLSTADRPRQGRYDSIRPPGLAGTPPDDVSSTRRGSRPRSSKRGTV